MKFEDENILGSTKDIKTSLRRIISFSNEEGSKLVHVQQNDCLLLTLRGLANYTGVLFDRLISHRQLPIEYSAVGGRNLFECYLMVAYILKEPSKAKEFISQKTFEDLEINEGFLSLTTATTSEASIQQIQERMDYIKEVIETNGLTPSKKWNVSNLADRTNNKLEYNAFFKLYSKYVHPSSWIVNSYDHETDNPVFKNIFLLQGQHYASCITKLISKHIGEQNIT